MDRGGGTARPLSSSASICWPKRSAPIRFRSSSSAADMVKDLAVESERGLFLGRGFLWPAASRLGELVEVGEVFACGNRFAEHFLSPFRIIRVFDARHCRVSFPFDRRFSG